MDKNGQKRIRVLHCIHSLQGGGAERQLKLLVDVSHSVGIDSGVFCVNSKGNDIKDAKVKIYNFVRVSKLDASIFRALNQAINDFKPDIVHGWLPEAVTIPAQLMAFLHGIPCVYSYRNRMYFHRALTIVDYLCALAMASRIVSNNPVSQSNFLYRWLFSVKNGLEIRNAVQIAQKYHKSFGNNDQGPSGKILFVGRIASQKNWECLIKALPLIAPRFNWELTICGAGEQESQLLELVNELQLGDRVKHLGYCEDIYLIMRDADVMVLPSWYEGMPNVLLESLEIGLPCIVSEIPAHKSIIDKHACALTFDPASPSDLATTLNSFFGDQTLARKLSLAGRIVAKEFTPECMASQYVHLYSEMLYA